VGGGELVVKAFRQQGLVFAVECRDAIGRQCGADAGAGAYAAALRSAAS
jgi:hypothetical protein